MPQKEYPPIDPWQSLAQLRNGGLPTRARQRLADEAGPDKKLFTSDLSVNEFLVTRAVNCQPISQVLGSSIYHIGVIPDYKGATKEISVISDGHRNARRLAVSRLYQEAQAVGADAVIGMRLSERLITAGAHGKGGDDGDQVFEFTVIGTAVRAPWITHPPEQPVITDLSGQDLWALAQDGFEPCGFFFEFCRYHVWHVMKDDGWTPNGEITAAANAVDQARRLVTERLLAQSTAARAEFVVGSDIKVDVREVPCGYEGCRLNDLDVDISWFATGVRRIPNWNKPEEHRVPPLILGMMPLGRKKTGDFVQGEEDESRELEEIGKRAEERAAEEGERGE